MDLKQEKKQKNIENRKKIGEKTNTEEMEKIKYAEKKVC